tara:strand:- start:2141 stop:3274 length:1134 start_codon:yes stop_codon:yes gene_type:complete
VTEIHSFASIDAKLGTLGGNIPAPRNLFISAARLQNKAVKPREWVVDGLIPRGTVTLLGGDGGSGKSLLAMMLAVSVASSKECKWLHRLPDNGHAIYCGAEDDMDEMHRRLQSITEANFMNYTDLERLHVCSLAGQDALLAIDDPKTHKLMPTPLWGDICAKVEETRPALVIFDTLADLFGGNENDRSLARQFIGILRGLAIQYQCAVVLLAHPSLSGLSSGTGTSGSTAWNNSVRSRLYVERVFSDGYEPDPNARKLSVKKANYGTTGEEIMMKWNEGVFEAEKPETGLDKMAHQAKAERIFLRLLEEVSSQGRTVNPNGGSNYAPKIFAQMPDSEGVVKKAFSSAMERLLSKGTIKVHTDDSNKNREKKYLVRVS